MDENEIHKRLHDYISGQMVFRSWAEIVGTEKVAPAKLGKGPDLKDITTCPETLKLLAGLDKHYAMIGSLHGEDRPTHYYVRPDWDEYLKRMRRFYGMEEE